MGWGGVNSDPRRVHDGWDTPTRPSPHIVQHLRIWGRQAKPWGSKGRRGEARGGHVRQGEATGGQGRPGKARGSQGRQGKARGSQGRQKGGRGHPSASDGESVQINLDFALFGAGEGVGPPEASVGQGPAPANTPQEGGRNPSYACRFASNKEQQKCTKSVIRTRVCIQRRASEVHEKVFSPTKGSLRRRGAAEAAQRRRRGAAEAPHTFATVSQSDVLTAGERTL